MQLITERLHIREFELADVPHLAAYQKSQRYLEHYDSPPDARSIVSQAMEWSKDLPRINYQFAICLKDATLPIGSVGMRGSGYSPREAEIGFELNPAYWGHGYAKEAPAELISFEKEHSIQALHAITNQANTRAQGLLERLGFAMYKVNGNDAHYTRLTAANDDVNQGNNER